MNRERLEQIRGAAIAAVIREFSHDKTLYAGIGSGADYTARIEQHIDLAGVERMAAEIVRLRAASNTPPPEAVREEAVESWVMTLTAKGLTRCVVVPSDWPLDTPVTVTRRRAAAENSEGEGNGE